MGWDITDFGGGDFGKRGLVIFCVRNGLQSDSDGKPYAEKLLVDVPDDEAHRMLELNARELFRFPRR